MNASENIHLRAMEPEDLDLLYRIENEMQKFGISPNDEIDDVIIYLPEKAKDD